MFCCETSTVGSFVVVEIVDYFKDLGGCPGGNLVVSVDLDVFDVEEFCSHKVLKLIIEVWSRFWCGQVGEVGLPGIQDFTLTAGGAICGIQEVNLIPALFPLFVDEFVERWGIIAVAIHQF